jgi:hypothetical protein
MSEEDKQWFKDWKEGYISAFNEKYDALVAERDALQKQLDEEIPYIDKFHIERDTAIYERDALAKKLEVAEEAIMDYWRTGNTEKLQQVGCEIERIGKESGINLTIGEEDGKV